MAYLILSQGLVGFRVAHPNPHDFDDPIWAIKSRRELFKLAEKFKLIEDLENEAAEVAIGVANRY